MKSRIATALAAIFLGLGSFQNCSLVNSSHSDMSSVGKTCLSTAQRAFMDTYYPQLRSQCSLCHDKYGAGISWFASRDPSEAFESFINTSREKVNMQMVNDAHPGPYNGPHQQTWVDAQSAQWSRIDQQVDDCSNANAITTTAKNTPVQEIAIPTSDNVDSNRRPWRVLEFDLYSEVLNEAQRGKIEMFVRIRYRESGPGVVKAGVARAGEACRGDTAPANCEYTRDIGYEFSQPMGRLHADAQAGTRYALYNLSLLRNGRKMSSATSFEAIQGALVDSATDTSLIISGVSPGVLSSKSLEADVFQMRFAKIVDGNGQSVGDPLDPDPVGPTVPTRVTFAELSSSGNTYGYLARSCFGCHSGVTPAGGLNLSDYATAAAVSTSIKARVNNSLRPMPPTGLLPQFDRDVISRWADIGAPQN